MNEATNSIPAPNLRATRYELSCLPEDDINARAFTITVEYRGRGKWAVLDGPFVFDADGDRDYEPSPSNREDEWLARHRFDLDTALELARKFAPQMCVNGWTVANAIAARTKRMGEGDA